MKTNTNFAAIAFLLVLTLSYVSAITDVVYLDDYVITYSYSGAEEDDTFSLTVAINNTGIQKEEVYFEFDEDDPFDLDSGEWEIGTLGENEEVSKSFRIDVDSGTDSGDYDLAFTLEDSKDDYEEEFEISVDSNEADLVVGGVSSSPQIIMAGQDDIKLEVTIENMGDGDANFVLATLELPEGFEKSDSYSDFVNLGSIDAGSSKTATFYINTDDDVSLENVGKIKLEYKTDSDKKSDVLSFDIPVKGKPSFEILSSYVSPTEIYAGSSGTLQITVQNNGQKLGEETSVRIFENTDIPLSFSEKTKYVGDLDSGDVGSAIFSFDVDDDSAQASSYLVKVQVRTVSSDSVLTEEFNVPVRVSEKESNSFTIIIFAAVVLLVLLVLLLVYLIRK